MASNLEAVSMIADIGQQQWSCMIFRLSDRTPRSRVRIFVIWQELVKFQAAAWLLVAAWILAISWHGGPVQTAGTVRERAAHKSRAAWAVSSLGTAWEIHHIYEDLNESSSARPEGSQQLEIPLGLNIKRAACFSSPAGFSSGAGFLPGAGISTPARILSPAWFFVDARIL